MTGELWRKHRWLRWLASLLAVTVIVTVIGPFNTFAELALPARFAYWLGVIAVAGGQWLAVSWVLGRLVGRARGRPWRGLALDLGTAGIAALPISAELALLHGWLFGAAPGFAELYRWVALTSAVVCAGFYVFRGLVVADAADRPGDPPAAGDAAPFADRIPARIKGDLFCLKAEDHYLRVYTTAGDDLILFRLKDAVAELRQADGLQVHRSYWVARVALADVQRSAGKTTLTLKNGLRVPVGAKFRAALRRAGWAT